MPILGEIDGQVIVLILFVVISGIQWLIKKVQGKGQEHEISESLEDIYDDFREEIIQRQTTIQQANQPEMIIQAPPPKNAVAARAAPTFPPAPS